MPVVNETDDYVSARKQEILSQIKFETTHLSLTEVKEISDLIANYSSIFCLEGDSPECYTGDKHEIHTGDHPPMPYRTTPQMQAEIRKQVSNMLENNIIKKSTSS